MHKNFGILNLYSILSSCDFYDFFWEIFVNSYHQFFITFSTAFQH